MNWTISTSNDAGQTWTKVQDFAGTEEGGMAQIALLQIKAPALYSLAPAAPAPGSAPAS